MRPLLTALPFTSAYTLAPGGLHHYWRSTATKTAASPHYGAHSYLLAPTTRRDGESTTLRTVEPVLTYRLILQDSRLNYLLHPVAVVAHTTRVAEDGVTALPAAVKTTGHIWNRLLHRGALRAPPSALHHRGSAPPPAAHYGGRWWIDGWLPRTDGGFIGLFLG